MLTNKPIVVIDTPARRMVHTPFLVTEELLKDIRAVEGVTFMDINPWGKYEFGYVIGACFNPAMVDENVRFAMDEYVKRTHKEEAK